MQEEGINDKIPIQAEEKALVKGRTKGKIKREENFVVSNKAVEKKLDKKKFSKAMIKQNILKIKQLIETHKDVRRRKNIIDDDNSGNKESMDNEDLEYKTLLSTLNKKKAYGRKSR